MKQFYDLPPMHKCETAVLGWHASELARKLYRKYLIFSTIFSSSEIPDRDLSGRHYRLYSGDETLSTVYVGTPV